MRRKLAPAVALAAVASSGASVRHSYSFLPEVRHELSANVVPGALCDPHSPVSLAGYFGVEGSRYDANRDKHYFYWFFERRPDSLLPEDERPVREEDEADVPFVVWLNGGPGCSSMLGLLTENGPCRVNEDGQGTTINPHSWTEVAHVLFLDQPARAGYSYGDGNDDDVEMVAEDAYYFLQSFYKSSEGEKYRDLPLYLTGESYAGHYLPAIAKRISVGNADPPPDHLELPLAGMAIGNGMIDEAEQLPWYPEFAYRNPAGIEIVDEEGYEAMKTVAATCAEDARRCNEENDSEVEREWLCQIASACAGPLFAPLDEKGLSVYNINQTCVGDLCSDMTPLMTFLNLPETKSALGVPPNVTWTVCEDSIGMNWSDEDRIATLAPPIADLLDDGLPVLIYAGDLDYICNYMGNRAVALNLDWAGREDFRAAEEHDWGAGGGTARSAGNLSYLQVYDAGHMVPTDQPGRALAMIAQFLNGDPF